MRACVRATESASQLTQLLVASDQRVGPESASWTPGPYWPLRLAAPNGTAPILNPIRDEFR